MKAIGIEHLVEGKLTEIVLDITHYKVFEYNKFEILLHTPGANEFKWLITLPNTDPRKSIVVRKKNSHQACSGGYWAHFLCYHFILL